MKNNIYFSGISFMMCLFWLVIYLVGKQILAVYLAGAFGAVFIIAFSWILLKSLILVSVQSSVEMDKLKSKTLLKKSPIKV